MSVQDGGPAFPRPHSADDTGDYPRAEWAQEGMSLRDWFAAQAIAGWGEGSHGASFGLPTGNRDPLAPINNAEQYAARMAEFAYMVADAMLKARSQETGS